MYSFNKSESDASGYRNKTLLARIMVYPGQFKRIQRMYDKLKEAGVEKIEFRYIRPLVGTGNEEMPATKLDTNREHDKAIIAGMRITGRNCNLNKLPNGETGALSDEPGIPDL